MKRLKKKGLRLVWTKPKNEHHDSSGLIGAKEFEETYYIFKNSRFTPRNHCVDHGSYYEIAKFSHYIRIAKATMTVTSNLVDVDKFAPEELYTAEIVNISEE